MVKQASATWLVDHNIYWPLAQNAPWFILTHYPEVNDSFSWLDGAGILLFIFGATVVVGGPLYIALWLADCLLPGVRSESQRKKRVGPAWIGKFGRPGVHRLAQGLIPAAGAGVFLGLSATTLTLLKNEGMPVYWATSVRFVVMGLALAWSLRLVWRIIGKRRAYKGAQLAATFVVTLGLLPFCAAWYMFFAVW
jgi:hypothetical protein